MKNENEINALKAKITDLERLLAEKDKIIKEQDRKLKNGNFEPYRRTKYSLDTNEILSLKKQGWSNCAIARKLGCSEITIRRRLKEINKS